MTLTDINETWTRLDSDNIELKRIITESLSPFLPNHKFLPAVRAGVSDGRVRYWKTDFNEDIFIPKGAVYSVIKLLEKHGTEYEYHRSFKSMNVTLEQLDKFILTLELPFDPYDYQKEAALDAINDRRLFIKAATGAGKSLILYIIIRFMQRMNLKTILIVPSISLTSQMYNDFKDYGWKDIENYVKMIGGENNDKELHDNITISTWQSLQFLPIAVFNEVGCTLVDEAQSLKNVDSKVRRILQDGLVNSSYKIGLSGTLPKERAFALSCVSATGEPKTYITAGGLIKRGLATPLEIHALFFNHNQRDRELVQRMKFQDEEKFLSTHDARNRYISMACDKISQSGNTLLLFSTIANGKLLLKNLLTAHFPGVNVHLLDRITPKYLKLAAEEVKQKPTKMFFNGDITQTEIVKIQKFCIKEGIPDFSKDVHSLAEYGVYFVYGGVEATQREYIRQVIATEKNCIVLGSKNTMSTGINAPNLHNLILAGIGKSEITIVQSLGRVMRLHDSKSMVNVYDICDNLEIVKPRSTKLNYMMKHANARIEIYLEQEYTVHEVEIELPQP